MALLLTRRQTLQSLAASTVFASGFGGLVLSLAGCGGGGGGNGAAGEGLRARSMTVTLSLPAGASSPAPSSLALWTSGGTSTPAADGQAKAVVINGGPQYAEARDASGRMVLAGFVGEGRATMDATTTAEVLAYYALGGALLAPEGRVAVLNGVRDLSGFEAISTAAAAQIASRGYVARDDDVATAVREFAAAHPETTRGRAATSRETLVQPDAEASGLILDTIVDGELKITNNYLRRGHVWLERTHYELEDGSENSDVVLLEEFDLEVPARYGGFTGAVADILRGEYAWTPVTMPTKKIPIAPTGAVQTTYRLSVAGIGLNPGDYDELSEERKDVRNTLAIKALVFDLLLPVIANIVLPLKGEEFDDFIGEVDSSVVMADAINLLRKDAPEILALLNSGEYVEAAQATWNSAWTSNTMLPLVSALFASFVRDRILGKMTFEAAKERFENAMAIFGAVDLAASCFDTGLLLHDWAQSNHADVFTITSLGGKITVTPDRTEAKPTETVNVRTVIQNKNPDATYRYEWSVTAGYRLTAGDGRTTDEAPGGVLASNFDVVTLASKENKEGSATVTCKVTRIDGEPDVDVDQKSATVAFKNGASGVVPLEGTFEFVQGVGQVYVYVLVPKLDGNYAYTFSVRLPEFNILRNENAGIIGYEFGPGTKNWGGAWNPNNPPPNYIPPVVDDHYRWPLTTLYPFPKGASESELLARAQEAWGGQKITATARTI